MWTKTLTLYFRFGVSTPRVFPTKCVSGLRTMLSDARRSASSIQFLGSSTSQKPRQELRTNEQLTFVRQFYSKRYERAEQIQQLSETENENKNDETGNESKKDETEKENKKDEDRWYKGKNAWKAGLAGMTVTGLIGAGSFLFLYGAPIKDPDGKDVKDEFSDLPNWLAYFKRASREFHFLKKMIQDPASEKLLPDRLEEHYYPPYTLVLEMTGVLVHPDWTLANGWRFKKRPALEYFLQQVGQHFEVVVFTHEPGMIVNNVISCMDPNGYIMFRLFREATNYVNGAHVKDLSFLNRDLTKVIVIDCDPKAMSLQPENGILLQKWSGDDADRKLIDLANLLRAIAYNKVDDVRPVLEYYSQFDDPLEAFKERQKMLQEETEKKDAPAVGKVFTPSKWSFNKWGLKN